MFSAYSRRRFTTSLYNYSHPNNPRVFMDVSKDGKGIGKLVFELYKNHAPKTVANFEALCTGDNKEGLKYAGSPFHRVIQGFMAQGGDITEHNGTGGASIYGDRFDDENLKLRHHKRGILSMANSGENTNSSQFFVTFDKTNWLDGYHVVFGELVEGDAVLSEIEKSGSRDGATKGKIEITNAGTS